MKGLRLYAIAAAAATLLLVSDASGQLGKGPKSNPPSSPGQSSPPPKPRENPPAPKPKETSPSPKPKEQPPKNDPKPGNTPAPKPRVAPGSGSSSGSGSNSGSGQPPLGQIPRNNPPANNDRDRNGGGPSNINVGGRTDENPLGRIPRNTTRPYGGTVNNQNGRDRRPMPDTIRTIPDNDRSLPSMVLREDDPRRRSNIYRSGYYHYNRDWCDDYFYGGWYVFDPYAHRSVFSPWYWYPSLPGYLNSRCVKIINLPIIVWQGSYYNYRPYDYNDRGWGYEYNSRNDLDESIDDLVYAFERQDRRALARLMPSRGDVHIFLNGRYDYSLSSDDYYDLMLDAIYSTYTRRYDVVSVQRYGREAEVTVRHEITDPWGRRQTVYHWYRLENDRRGYVITRFGTSDRNRW